MGVAYGQHGCYYYVDPLPPKSLTLMWIFLSRDGRPCSAQPLVSFLGEIKALRAPHVHTLTALA